MIYVGIVRARTGVLIGGTKEHWSTPFKTELEAMDWLDVVAGENKRAGRDVGETEVKKLEDREG